MLARRFPLLRPGMGFLLAYALTAALMHWSTEQPLGFPAWSAHHGLSFGCLLRYGLRFTPFTLLAALGEFLLIKAPDVSPLEAVLGGIVASLAYAAASGTYVRTRTFQQEFPELRDVSWFLAAAGVAALVGSIVLQAVRGPAPDALAALFERLYGLWIAEVTGIIVVAPLLLVHAARANAYVTAEFRRSAEPVAQGLAFVSAMFVVLWAARASDMQYFYLAFVPLIWVSMRYGVAGSTIVAFAIQCTLILGLFLLDGDTWSQLTIQWRMLALSITGLYLGVAVSERRSIRNALLEREAELRAVLLGAPDSIFTVDRRGIILGVNHAAEHLFDMRTHDLEGRAFETLFPALTPAQLVDVANREVTAIGPGGMHLDTELSLRRISVANRSFTIAIVRDITQRKALERGLEMQQLGIQRTLRQAAAGELATTVAHELNQPLSAIRSFARACEMLAENLPEETARLRATLSKILAEAERAGNVVRRLREFFRSGVLNREEVDIVDLIGQVVRTSREGAHAHGIEIVFDARESVPAIAVDRVQIETVLHNLIANAIEAIAEHGGKGRYIRLDIRREPTAVAVRVEDSGPGVAADMVPRLFEPFVTSKLSGMGLGLAICRTLVEAHGGEIGVERSTLGGACFRILLPADKLECSTEPVGFESAQEKERAATT